MAETTITNLPNAAALTGAERVPMDQGGTTVDATTGAIAATLPDATTSTAGKLSAADKTKLDSITADQATIVRRWVRNETGSTIAKGIPVYISVSNGVTPTIIPADASTEETAARTIGLTQAAINHQAYGWVIEVGRLDGINTSTLTEGQIIWLSETTGQMTTTRPTQPAHGVILGYCVKQGAGTSGIVDVKVDNGLELAELHDVLLTGASTGDVLALASDGLWKKRTLGSAAAAATTDFAPAAQGVSNGNGHNHDGGDGAQIAYSSLSGTPTLGGAAALNVGTTAGTVAAGDAPAGAIAALKAEANPLPQYLQPAEIIAGTNMSVDTTTTPGSAILNATGGSGSPGGTTGQMQFNNAGAFAGVAGSSVDPATGNTTFSARWIQSTNSAASAPASTLTGTWFTGGTTTTTKPHYLIEPAGTTSTSWSTAGTGFGVNAPSGFAGDLLWLGVNGTRTISINSALGITTNISGGANIAFTNANTGQDYFTLNTSQVILRRDMLLAWSNSGTTATADDLRLLRDAAHTLAQRSGSNAQTSRIYNTFTSGTNFERLNLRWTTNEAIIDTEAGSGGGTLRGLKIGSASTSLLGFYGATPAVQGVAVANATDAASVITQLNALLARVRTLGLIAT